MVISRLGNHQWPARVIETHDGTNSISYWRQNGTLSWYEGYAGHRLRVVTVEDSSDGETVVILRSKESGFPSATTSGMPAAPPAVDKTYTKSVANLEQEAARRRQMFGNESPELADTLGLLSRALRDEGRLAEAEIVRRENLAIRRKVLGENDPQTAISYDGLGKILQGENKLVEAEACFRAALAIRRKTFGEQSLQARNTLVHLNDVLKLEGKPLE